MKKTIVWVCSFAILAGTGIVNAETAAPQKAPQDFAAKKANILQRMDDREQKMAQRHKEARACVQAAQNDADLKDCHDKIRAEHKAKRDKFREMRDQRRQQQPQ
ncbi:MAG: hypothetical protein GX423_08230 [Nitrospiraceae bacterium]|nr:hypothetical protein [Nitrospiraceae bacterium]